MIVVIVLLVIALAVSIYRIHKLLNNHVYPSNESLIKLGDIVYLYSESFNCILPYEVDNIEQEYQDVIGINYIYNARFPAQNSRSDVWSLCQFDSSDIDKTVFLTKDEAIKNLGGK